MKNLIISIAKSVLHLLVISSLCNIIYNLNGLNSLFNFNISYSQWVSIIVIIQLIFPINNSFNYKEKNDE
jgi:ABC-type Mn2+/Zn2+ transport system permease subunit